MDAACVKSLGEGLGKKTEAYEMYFSGDTDRFLPLLGGIIESDSFYCDRCNRSVVCMSLCPSVCPSVTLVHPAKAVGWNEMPFGRQTRGPK